MCGNVKSCRDPGSNQGPSDLQSDALPTELSWRRTSQFLHSPKTNQTKELYKFILTNNHPPQSLHHRHNVPLHHHHRKIAHCTTCTVRATTHATAAQWGGWCSQRTSRVRTPAHFRGRCGLVAVQLPPCVCERVQRLSVWASGLGAQRGWRVGPRRWCNDEPHGHHP